MYSLEMLISRWSDRATRAASQPNDPELFQQANEARHALEMRIAEMRGHALAVVDLFHDARLLRYIDGEP